MPHTHKNILFITADQWRGDCLSSLGHPDVKTPHLDQLLAESTGFGQHYSVCVPCGPARASLLTGMYLQNHRSVRNGTPLDSRHINLAQCLRVAGYTPMLFGYTDTSLDPRINSEQDVCAYGYEGMMPGFEDGLFLPGELPEKWLAWLRQKGFDFKNIEEANQTVERDDKSSGDRVPTVAYPAKYSQAAFLTEGVIDYIDQFIIQINTQNNTPANQGWCVHLSYLRPHPPFVAPQPYDQMYEPASLAPLRCAKATDDTKQVEHPWMAAARSPLGDWPEPWMAGLHGSEQFEEKTQQIRAAYYGLISKVDHYIGELISYLKAIKEYDNTLIIFTSDHGELLGDYGLFGKRGYLGESYHVPLIIRDPAQAINSSEVSSEAVAGKVVKAFTESVDILPTILDWLDQPIPRQCDGYSLLPFLSHQPDKTCPEIPEERKPFPEWRQAVHWEYDFREGVSSALAHRLGINIDQCQLNAVRDKRFLYVHFTALPALLFDLQKDPLLQHNVIDSPDYNRHALHYAQQLLSWRMANDERVLTGLTISRKGIYQSDGSRFSNAPKQA